MRRGFVNGKQRRIVGDPGLRPEEKETSLHLLGNSKRVDIYSLHPTVVRGLLAQPEFEVEELLTKTVKGKDVIVGVKGTLPIAALKIGRSRRDPHLSRVFSRRASTQKAGTACRSDTNCRARGESLNSPVPRKRPGARKGF